jgi:outer membrane protein assembly factor BamB
MRPLERDDPQSVGEFRLQARLGAGGMGRVYLGYSPAGRAVAVKICHPELAADPEFVARFAREVAAARAVNGLYTAQVIDAGPGDSPPWLATSYVPGPSLSEAVAGYGPLSEPAVWRLAAGLAEALQAVHARGLVHRDLKPSNVLLAADGPRVIDFGIARALDGTALTATDFILGTPAYMAPEQASGEQVTPASDVFALGSVLCFAATGDAPFGDGEPATVLYRIVHAQPALEAVHGSLHRLIADCLAKDPADRPTLAQVLRTGQAQAPRPGGSAASFWPDQVAALIAAYEAGPDETDPAGGPEGGPVLERVSEGTLEPIGEPTRTNPGVLVAPDRPTAPGPGDATRLDKPVGPLSRRRALVGLSAAGILAAGGLAAGGWAYTRPGPSPGSVSRPTGPSRLLWAKKTGGPVSSSAALAGGILYIGSDDHNVYAIEAASGKPVRTFPTSGAVSGGVTVADGTLFAGSADHQVHAFRVGTGDAAWAYPTGGPVRSTPAVVDGLVCVGSDDHRVYGIHAGTGKLAWRYGTGGPVRSEPRSGSQAYSNYIYVGSDDGYLYAIHTDGRLLWRFATSGPVTAGPAYGLGFVYVGDSRGNVLGLSAEGPPEPKTWEKNFGGVVSGTPVIAGYIVYLAATATATAATATATAYAVNAYTGYPIWHYPLPGKVNSGLASDGVTVYLGDDDGYLYAIDIASITVRWQYHVGAAVRSQILLENGVIYFGSDDHHVYALRTA